MSLSANTKYDTWIVVSTIKGSVKGPVHSFTTQKYGKCNFFLNCHCATLEKVKYHKTNKYYKMNVTFEKKNKLMFEVYT